MAHSLLTPSAAERWLNCPPSARLTADMPDTDSPYAREGTLAHALAELTLRRRYLDLSTRKYNAALKDIEADVLFAPEMRKHIETYYQYIDALYLSFPARPYLAVEVSVDISVWAPNCRGTIDCVMICGTEMHIIDFKYGQGVPVGVEGNPQLMLYALGALDEYRTIYDDVRAVTMHIVQPRLDAISSHRILVDDLTAWGSGTVIPTAQAAWDGVGGFAAGSWCRFCKAKNTCRTRNGEPEFIEPIPKPQFMSSAEIADRIRQLRPLVKVLAGLEEYALAECLSGGDIPGFKAVEGRANRAWTDRDAAFKAAQLSGIEEAMLYKREPVTLSALEKLMGKKDFAAALSTYVCTPPGKPTLVEESDNRQPITRMDAQAEFENTEEE